MSTNTMAPPKRPEIKTALPGPKGKEIIAADAQFVTPSYPRPSFKLVAERAQGVWVDQVTYLDPAPITIGVDSDYGFNGLSDTLSEMVTNNVTFADDYFHRVRNPDPTDKLGGHVLGAS